MVQWLARRVRDLAIAGSNAGRLLLSRTPWKGALLSNPSPRSDVGLPGLTVD